MPSRRDWIEKSRLQEGRMPLWLWPNLLSLDAPLVALLWQLLFLRCLTPRSDPSQLVAAVLLALAVWLIYAADRMLDAWTGAGTRARHEFYRRNWRYVLPVWLVVLIGGVGLALFGLPGMMLLHGVELGAGALLYLGLVHGRFARGRAHPEWKEAGVAIVFALGTTLVAWPSIHHVSDVLAVAMFALLCWLNCTVIEDWEQGKPARWLVMAGAAVVGLSAAFVLSYDRPVLGAAEATAALLLILVDRWREPLDRSAEGAAALRVLADVALLSPLLFLPLAGRVL